LIDLTHQGYKKYLHICHCKNEDRLNADMYRRIET